MTTLFGVLKWIGVTGLCLYALLWGLIACGYRIVTTHSVPMGLWKTEPLTRPLQKGDIAWWCPPDTAVSRLAKQRGYYPEGDCPGGYPHVMKPVAALPGDTVVIDNQGVKINGQRLANSESRDRDLRGNALQAMRSGAYQVASGSVWLLSSFTAESFDSRYFGPVSMTQVHGLAYPVWVAETKPVSAPGI